MKLIRIPYIASALLLSAVAAPYTGAQTIDGDWTGQLEVGRASLKLVFHISLADKTVSMDSPSQNAYGIEGQTVYMSADSVHFKVPKLMMNYRGGLHDGEITGTFRQGIMIAPLAMSPGVKKAARPQTPYPPFPYATEEVVFENKAGGAVLAGTLTTPANCTDDTPVVVLVSGSGQQNRDEELFEHKPFAVIADYLARNGIASLRYDDRGVGGSTGEVVEATTADFAGDATAALDWLRGLGRFGKTGIIGHSEGGLIACMTGAAEGGPDFIVSVAGPAIKGTRTIAYQNKVALMKSGVDENTAEDFRAAVERALEYKLAHPAATELPDADLALLYPQHDLDDTTRKLAASIRGMFVPGDPNRWMLWFLAYDPAADLKALDIPAMLIYGEKDRQVPPALNKTMAEELAPAAIVKEYPGLNHLMQHAATGDVEEYVTIEETISPEVLADIVSFIGKATTKD